MAEKVSRVLSTNCPNKDARDLEFNRAQIAYAEEHESISIFRLFRENYKAAIWSMAISFSITMEGFDIQLIASFFGLKAFNDQFGNIDKRSGVKAIDPQWQAGLANAALVGQIAGLAINGFVQDRYGHKRVMQAFMGILIAVIFVPVFARSLPVLCVGNLLLGIPLGVFQSLATSYAVEICPQNMREYLATYVDVNWVVGAALGSGVLRAAINIQGEWSWRLPYVLQWAFPLPLLIIAFLCPESPWWLVRKGRLDEAMASLRRLNVGRSKISDNATADAVEEERIRQRLAMMIHTTDLERKQTRGTWSQCFQDIHLRRTEIVCMTWSVQWWCGYGLVTYATTFFQRAGLDSTESFNLNMTLQCIRILGPFLSWMLMAKFGRRTIYMSGMVVSIAVLLSVAGLGFGEGQSFSKAIGALLVIYAFIYTCTIGPVCYPIVAEIPSGILRTKQIVLARSTYNLIGFFTNSVTPRMVQKSAWNWGAKAGFFYAGTCFLALIWCYFRLPETKGRTFGEMEMLFEMKTSARKFKSTNVDQFGMTGAQKPSSEAST